MKEILVKIIEDSLEHDFDYSKWTAVLIDVKAPYSIYYLLNTVEYYSVTYGGINLSCVSYENNKPVAIFPLFAYIKNNKWVLSSNGFEILDPLFSDKVSKKVKKRVEKSLFTVIENLSKVLHIKENFFLSQSHLLSNWYLLWLQKAQQEFVLHYLSVNLNEDLENIRLNLRKSYKSLVNKSFKEWKIEVCENNVSDIFEEFKSLHIEVAKRETRSGDSWTIQKKQIEEGEAFLVTARDHQEVLIGAGLFNYTKYIGSYGVGVYKRELFNKPIGHGIQMKAIEALKNKGCIEYEIGRRHYEIDKISPTDKELSISHYKEGFATNAFVKTCLIVSM